MTGSLKRSHFCLSSAVNATAMPINTNTLNCSTVKMPPSDQPCTKQSSLIGTAERSFSSRLQ